MPVLTPLFFALFLPFSLFRTLDTAWSRPVLPPHQEVSIQQTISVRDFLMTEINSFRKSKGLSPVSTDSYVCSFADIRAKEISSAFNHDGFNNRINNHTLPYPSYRNIVENLAQTSDFKNVVNMWINSSGHAQNLLADVIYGCVGNFGNFFAYEGWKP
ncbi:CAP domain-containing protein [Candidatus Daviesbacteria bacterium]|nr:CAP domain-containing protein [Candidatus Daviesbacteria bacterium]